MDNITNFRSGLELAMTESKMGYPFKAGHCYDFKDLALPGVFVSEAEAGPRYGRQPFQRGLGTTV